MRIAVKTDTDECPADLESEVSDRLRCALGSHAVDVRHVSVLIRGASRSVLCTIRLKLRGSHELEVSCEGSSLPDALRFSVRRAGAAVARRADTHRILGS